MARINLLPWREEARRERQRQFLYSLMGTLVLGAVLVLIVGVFFDQKISDQEARNQRIQVEINRLEQRIARISELEETRARRPDTHMHATMNSNAMTDDDDDGR